MSYRIKILPVTEKQIKASIIPKYTIMVLPDKGGAVRQTPDLIKELNTCLENMKFGLDNETI